VGIFGWDYPPGAANDPNAPYNQDIDEDNAVTVDDLCENAGVRPIRVLIEAIDKYNVEAVDIKVRGKWLNSGDRKELDELTPTTVIDEMRVRGIAWDGSDWEWSKVIKTLDELSAARKEFIEALSEHTDEPWLDEGMEL